MKCTFGIFALCVWGVYGAAVLSDDNPYTVEDLITSAGYPCETHTLTTSDGYILTIHRIPHGLTNARLGKTALLAHGLFNSAADWLLLGPEKALGFRLADAGYDVWMTNNRGNTWSRKHVSLDPSDPTFWDFSWYEIGTCDYPETIDFVLAATGNSSLYYTGHSQGTTSYYVMNSILPQYNEKIKVAAHLAPIAFMKHLVSPLLQLIAPFIYVDSVIMELLGVGELNPSSNFTRKILANGICKINPMTEMLCENYVFAFCGFSPNEMNETLVPLILKYTPAGAATKQVMHYGQETQSGFFRQYDYLMDNIKVYGQIQPPDYDISKITAPTYLFYSDNDWLSSPIDVDRLCVSMGSSCVKKILVGDPEFNHLDYLYGTNASSLVYDDILDIFALYD